MDGMDAWHELVCEKERASAMNIGVAPMVALRPRHLATDFGLHLTFDGTALWNGYQHGRLAASESGITECGGMWSEDGWGRIYTSEHRK